MTTIKASDLYELFFRSSPVVGLKQNSGRSAAFVVVAQECYLKVSRVYRMYVTCKNV